MTAIIIVAACTWALVKLLRSINAKQTEREQQRIREEQARLRAEVMEQARRQTEQERAIAKAAKDREAIRKEQEKQTAQLAKHEEQIIKLEMRLASAESELAFNREQRERLFKLLDIEECERDAAIEGSRTWQAHHKKVISLENQIHTVQKRIDKAHMDKAYCESKLSA